MTNRTLEFVLRMSADQFVRATEQARQRFSQMANTVTADSRQMSTITHAAGSAVDYLRAAISRIGTGLQSVAGGLSRFRSELQQVGQAATRTGGSLQTIITAAAAFSASMYTINNTIGSVLPLFAKFDDVMRQVKVATEATGQQYQEMINLAEKMGATTRYSAQEAASALLVLTTSGLKADEAMTALPATLQLAAAAGTDLARAAEITTTIMNGYGFSATNLAAINDVLIRATLDTNSSLSDLGAAFSYVGPVAKATGLDFKDTAAVLGVMADAGFKGERGGTALSGALSRLINPTKEVEKTLKELSVTVSAGGGKLINLIDIFRKLTAAGATPAQMMKIFGEESGRAMIAAADRGVPAMEKLRTSLENATKTADRAAIEMEGGLGGSFRNLSSAAEGLGLKLGSDLAPAAKRAADSVASLFNELSQMPEPLRKNIELTSALVGGLALWVLGLRPLIAAMGAYTTAQIAATAATITFNRVLKTAGWVGLGLLIYEAGKYIHLWGENSEEATRKTDAMTDALERQRKAFEEQKRALKAVSPELKEAIEKQEEAAAKAKKRKDAAIAALSKPDLAPVTQKKSRDDEGGEGSTSPLSAFKSELERKKEATGDYFRNTLQMESAFWQEKRKISGLSQKDLAAIDHEIYQINKRQAHDSLNERLELLREEMDNALEGSQERINIAKRAAKEIGDAYGYESVEFLRARRVIENEERAHQAKMREFATLKIQAEKTLHDSRIAMEEENLRYKQEMELMSAREVIQAKQVLEEQSFQNTMRAMNAELALKRQGSTDQIRLQNDIKQAVLNHNLAIQKSNHDLAIQAHHDFQAVIAPIQTAIGSSLSGLVTHQTTVKQAMNTMWKSMLDQFTSFLAKRLSLWTANQLAETALGKAFGLVRIADQAAESTAKAGIKAGEGTIFQTVEGLKLTTTLGGSAARIAGQTMESTAINTAKASEGAVATATEGVKAAASTAGLGVQAATGSSSIMMSAWTGMANAYAAISAIPIVGPVMAPVVAAGVFAAIAALVKNLFSAEGGFDIPAGLNPVTKLHEREMVLPARYADVIRSLPLGGAGVSKGDTFHLHVSAIDAKSFESWFKHNAHAAAPGLRRMVRNAVPVK